ncbi:MAG: hypothetical protein JST14_18280, partial [Bacteroidetes bacterium]|nr:hypothetical protein [Bacteroidota bacterium]
ATYARHVIKDPELKAKYQAKVNAHQKSAYTVALRDYMNAPVIHYIKVTGDTITVKASDDFMVVTVKVEVSDASGKIIEKGDAERYKRHHLIWKYRSTIDRLSEPGIIIKAFATDIPGNLGSSEVIL